MEEIRKEIPWMPKWKYFVSNLGRVKNWKVKCRKWRILKFESNRYWHQRIKLYGDWWRNDVRHYQVHRLVYCVFNNLDYDFWLTWKLSNSYWLILHKDNDPLNNRLDNLYMWTQKENMQQCSRDWRVIPSNLKWEANWNSKLNEEKAIQILNLHYQGLPYDKIAEIIQVSKSTIWGIVKWRTRKHVARKTSGENGETPTGTIPCQAPQGWDEGVETNSIPLEQWWN